MLRLPEVNRNCSTQQQLEQLVAYLKQLVLQLDYELNELRKEKK